MSHIVRLTSTGQLVDVATREGANAFLTQRTGKDGFNFFSVDVKTANAIRQRERKKGKLNISDRQTLKDIYRKVANVASNCLPQLFPKKVPKTELEAYLNHAVEIFRQITNDRKWIKTGNLLQHDSFLMSSLVTLCLHPTAMELIFGEIKILETVSDMISTQQKPPTADIANDVIGLVDGAYATCRYNFEKKWSAEKTFKKLQSTRILEVYLRCVAIEGSLAATRESLTLKELLKCPHYVQKNFKEGTPCGDTVREIFEKKDGYSPRTLSYMNSLIQLSTESVFLPEFHTDGICQFCKKCDSEVNLFQCAKCRRTFYCSKACQRADWKSHKTSCTAPMAPRTKKNAEASMHLVNEFVHNSYARIMVRMVEESDKAGGLNFDEMIAELDLSPDSTGAIPLTKNPPEFQIVPISKYHDGTRLNEPGSIFAHIHNLNEEQLEKFRKNFFDVFENQQKDRKSTELLSVVCFPNGTSSFQSFSRKEDDSQKHVFSQEALEAFRSVVVDNDYSLLWEIFTTENAHVSIGFQLMSIGHCPPDFGLLPMNSDWSEDPQAGMAAIQNALEARDFATLAAIIGEEEAEKLKSVVDSEDSFQVEMAEEPYR